MMISGASWATERAGVASAAIASAAQACATRRRMPGYDATLRVLAHGDEDAVEIAHIVIAEIRAFEELLTHPRLRVRSPNAFGRI